MLKFDSEPLSDSSLSRHLYFTYTIFKCFQNLTPISFFFFSYDIPLATNTEFYEVLSLPFNLLSSEIFLLATSSKLKVSFPYIKIGLICS